MAHEAPFLTDPCMTHCTPPSSLSTVFCLHYSTCCSTVPGSLLPLYLLSHLHLDLPRVYPCCHSHLSLNILSQERTCQLHSQLLSTVSVCLIFVTVLVLHDLGLLLVCMFLFSSPCPHYNVSSRRRKTQCNLLPSTKNSSWHSVGIQKCATYLEKTIIWKIQATQCSLQQPNGSNLNVHQQRNG